APASSGRGWDGLHPASRARAAKAAARAARMRLQWFIVPPCGASPAQNERQAALCEPPAAKLQLDCKLLYTPGGGLSIPGGGLHPSQSRRPAGVSPAPPRGEPSVPPSNPANEW